MGLIDRRGSLAYYYERKKSGRGDAAEGCELARLKAHRDVWQCNRCVGVVSTMRGEGMHEAPLAFRREKGLLQGVVADVK